MGTDNSMMEMFDQMWIPMYVENLPWWRRMLARHFEKYKVTQKEYEDWRNARFKAPHLLPADNGTLTSELTLEK